MAGIPGTLDHHVDISTDVPQLRWRSTWRRRPGTSSNRVTSGVPPPPCVAGEEVGDIFRGGRAYDVVVWSVPAARDSVETVRNLMIDTPTGQRVRIADVASVAIRPNPNSIDREDGSRRLDVGTNVAGRDLGSVVQDLKTKLADGGLPPRIPRRDPR